jgi:MFS family permease
MPEQTNSKARFGGQPRRRSLDSKPAGFSPVAAEPSFSDWLEGLETIHPARPQELHCPPGDESAAGNPEPPENNRPFGFINYVWISIFWLGITYLWGSINGVILPKLNEQLVPENYKGSLLGIITALGMVVAIVVQPAIGALSDISRHRWGRRRPFILVGGVMVVVALLALAVMAVFVRQWWLLLVCYLFLQMADNVAQGAYQGFIPDSVPTGRRGRASGAMGIAQLLGNVGGVAGATYFIDHNQPALAIMVVIVVFSATLVPTLFLVKEKPLEGPAPPGRWKVVGGTLKEFLHHHDFVLFIISRLFVLTAIATISLFALYFLQDVIGAKEGTLTSSYTVLLLVVVGFSLISIFPAAWLSDKIGRKKLVIVACAIGVVGTLLMSTAHTMTQVMIFASLLGVATGSFNSIDWALATDLIPKGAAGRFMGISNLAGAGSQALAALVGGGLRDGFNALGETFLNQKNVGYSALFIAASVFFMLGIFFLLRVKEPQRSNE